MPAGLLLWEEACGQGQEAQHVGACDAAGRRAALGCGRRAESSAARSTTTPRSTIQPRRPPVRTTSPARKRFFAMREHVGVLEADRRHRRFRRVDAPPRFNIVFGALLAATGASPSPPNFSNFARPSYWPARLRLPLRPRGLARWRSAATSRRSRCGGALRIRRGRRYCGAADLPLPPRPRSMPAACGPHQGRCKRTRR